MRERSTGEVAMVARVDALAGYWILALAISLLAAFTLRMAVPPADIVRAAEAPRVMVLFPELTVPSGHGR